MATLSRDLRIVIGRLSDRLAALAEIGAIEGTEGCARLALTDEDKAEIDAWMKSRQALLARRDIDDIHRTIDHLNLTTQWAQSKASDEDLEDVTNRLLLAMHDLRSILVRKKADRLMKAKRDTGVS